MKIIGKEKVNTCCSINDLKVGDLFLYNGEIYMKIEEFEDYDGISLNAICLEDTLCSSFGQNNTLISINATLKIWR